MGSIVDELNDLLKPVWGAQKEIMPIWNSISANEKKVIKGRMDELFKDGLPFELKHDKSVYIHVFSTLAHVDIMACQIPLKFEKRMSSPELQQRLRAQLLDEIFHVLLSTKIVYLLCSPYAVPPDFNESTEAFCEFIRNEECPKVAVVLLNLIAEGIAEELVKCLDRYCFAPKVFDIILADERRHVSDADLYFEIGLPDRELIIEKVSYIEEKLLASMVFQYNEQMALFIALGVEGMHDFHCQVEHKYKQQLKKLDLEPGKKWTSAMEIGDELLKKVRRNATKPQEIEIQPFRRMLMTQWKDPVDPTMVGQFNVDVTPLQFFKKKYPSDTLTVLMLQTISKILHDYPEYQFFLHDQKLFQHQDACVSLVVKLPGCGSYMGMITFKDCHKLSVGVLSTRIKQILGMMVVCYKKREQLEEKNPWLKTIGEKVCASLSNSHYRPLLPAINAVCFSNIGASGYLQAKSPLLPNEASKVTSLEVQRMRVWNKNKNKFESRDLLPVSVSVDHRIFDGNLPLPKVMNHVFQEMVQQMQLSIGPSYVNGSKFFQNKLIMLILKKLIKTNERPIKKMVESKLNESGMLKMIDDVLAENLEFGYVTLLTLHTLWLDGMF